jgi:hypothetical protein
MSAVCAALCLAMVGATAQEDPGKLRPTDVRPTPERRDIMSEPKQTSPATTPFARRPGAHRLVLCNDGGTLSAPDAEAPLGVAGLVRSTIDPLRDTMVDTLYWQLGTDPYWGTPIHRLTEWYSHRTRIGARWGEGMERFNTASEWRVFETTRDLIAQGTDPVAVVVDEGHKAGLAVYLSFRINDMHDSNLSGGLNDPYLSPLKRQHPDWLIGEDGYGNRFAWNFAVPEVRRYKLDLMEEAINQYDLDGLNIDFCRWPKLFKAGAEQSGMPLLTEMVRSLRQTLDARGRALGRVLGLTVRVPGSIANCHQVGIDVAGWIREGLVSAVIVGEVHGWHYRLPIEQYKALADGTGCLILAQNLCAFKEGRPRSAHVLFGEKTYYSVEQFRAQAARHWQAGGDGMFLWNQHFLPFHADSRFDRQSWKEVGDPAVLARKDKHYLVGPAGRGGCLPLELRPSVTTPVKIEIADDLAAAEREGVLRTVTLRLLIEQMTGPDRIEYTLNGVSLDPAAAIRRINYNDTWLDFDVRHALRNGVNELTLTVRERNPRVALPLVLRSVEVLVAYAAPPTPAFSPTHTLAGPIRGAGRVTPDAPVLGNP